MLAKLTRHIYDVRMYVSLLVALIAFPLCTCAQMAIKRAVAPVSLPDTADLSYYGRKHFWRAAGETVGFNLGLWAFDRFIQKGDFAYISLNSVKENFRHGFIWDNDKLGTNTFLHPYNGSLYYNAGRANGFNFWQSELFAIGGSAMWELFMECEYPSTNDIIATPIGGAVLGEVFFRASDAVIDDTSGGWERFGREAAAFIISPMRSINRILTGDAWRRRATTGRVFGNPRFGIQVSLGYKMLEFQGHFHNILSGMAAQIDMEYGDRFQVKSTRPYDYFTVSAELALMKSQPVLSSLEIKGRLLAREIFQNYRSHISVGLYQHFDFFDSDTIDGLERVPYKLGIPACVGGGVMFRDVEERRWRLDAYAHLNGVILGSILSDHYRADERNYNWASGFSVKAGANLILDRDRLSVSLHHHYYRLFSWKGYRAGTDLREENPKTLNVQGDHSCASFNLTEFRASVKLFRNIYATLSFMNYVRSTRYRDFPHQRSSSMALRTMLTYKF